MTENIRTGNITGIIDFNDAWRVSTEFSAPSSGRYYGLYESYSNFHVGNTIAYTTITVKGSGELTIYIASYGEANYDYVIASKLDVNPVFGDNNTLQGTSVLNNTGCGEIEKYKELVYDIPNDGNYHTIKVGYRKDGGNDGPAPSIDRGFLLIKRLFSTNTVEGWLCDIEKLYNKGYQFVDGLQFTNGAYINVGFRGTTGFGFDCDAIIDSTNPSVSQYADYQVIGASRYSLVYNVNLFTAVNGAYNSAIFVAGSNTPTWNFVFGERHHYEVRYSKGNQSYAKVDGRIVGGPVTITWNNGNNSNEDVCIGRNSVSERIFGVVPIYDDSGDMVRRLQPAMRLSDSAYGYLDTMHGIFYGKTGGSGTIEEIAEE